MRVVWKCIIRNLQNCSRQRTTWQCFGGCTKRETGVSSSFIVVWGSRLHLHMKVGPVPKPEKKDPYPVQTVNRKKNLSVLQEWGMSMEGLEKMKVHPKVTELSTGAFKSKLCWLMDFFGFSKLQVVRIVRSYPSVLGLSTDENIRPFIQMLRSEGSTLIEIRNLIEAMPQILGKAKKFSFLAKCLEDNLKIKRPQAAALVVKNPRILATHTSEEQIIDMIEVFTELGVGEDTISTMVLKFPDLLLMPEVDLQAAVRHYTDLGLSTKDISMILAEAPSLLGKNFKIYVQDKLTFLVEEVGFGKKEALQLLVQDPRKFRDSIKIWRSTHKWMLERGMDFETARDFILKNTSFLSRNCRGLDEKFRFAVEVLGKQSQEVLRCPRYFNSSFEDIILFRTAFLQNKGEDCSQRALGHMVSSNGIFNKRHGYDDIEAFRKTWMQLSRSEKLAQIEQTR